MHDVETTHINVWMSRELADVSFLIDDWGASDSTDYEYDAEGNRTKRTKTSDSSVSDPRTTGTFFSRVGSGLGNGLGDVFALPDVGEELVQFA